MKRHNIKLSLICHNSSVTTAVSRQQCHDSSVTTAVSQQVSQQQCHNKCHNNSVTTKNMWFFQVRFLNVLKCCNFLRVQRRHNCTPAASFANCVMTLYLFKSASAYVSFYTNNSKMPNFELWHSCRKWPISLRISQNITYVVTVNVALH